MSENNQPAPGEGGVEPPKGFISVPSLEELQPTEAEKAKFAQLFAWMEASKHSTIRLGPPPPIECDNCQSLKHQLDAAVQRAERAEANVDSDMIGASCNCMTKTPDIQYHKPGCKYRLISERDELRKKLVECERERDEAVETCRTLVKNVEQPELKGASALVLYFPTDADREELIAAFKAAKPNYKTIKL